MVLFTLEDVQHVCIITAYEILKVRSVLVVCQSALQFDKGSISYIQNHPLMEIEMLHLININMKINC